MMTWYDDLEETLLQIEWMAMMTWYDDLEVKELAHEGIPEDQFDPSEGTVL